MARRYRLGDTEVLEAVSRIAPVPASSARPKDRIRLPSPSPGVPLRFRWIALAILFAPAVLAAQADSPVIRAVEVRRADVFDSTEATNWATRAANGLHITTREGVVRRELLLHPGDTYDSARVAETARNLRALGVFRRVEIDSVRTDSGLVLRVTTHDGWSTRPDARFRSTGGQAEYTLAFIEDNLLGTASQASVLYRKTTDRSSVTFGFLQPRLIAHRVLLGLLYEDRSDGRRYTALVGQPFHSLESRAAFDLLVDDRQERVLRFFGGETVASDSLQRRYLRVRADAALAVRRGTGGYFRAGLVAQVRRDDFVPESFSGAIPRTVTGAVGPSLRVAAREVRGDPGPGGVRAGGGRGPEHHPPFQRPRGPQGAWAMRATASAPSRRRTRVPASPAGSCSPTLGPTACIPAAGLDSGAVTLGGTLVMQPGVRHLALLHADAGWLDHPVPGEEYRPRARYRAPRLPLPCPHRRPGFYATAEYRYTLTDELWKVVGVGLAAFADYGGAWYDGEPAADRLGCGDRIPARRQPRLRRRGDPGGPCPAVRQRCPGRGLGPGGGERPDVLHGDRGHARGVEKARRWSINRSRDSLIRHE